MNKLLSEFFQRLRASAQFLIGRMVKHRLPQVAGSLSFTTVLSIVPLLIIMLSILTGFPVFERFQNDIQQFMLDNLMPEKMSKVIMKQIAQFADQSSRLSLAGSVLLLISALLTMSTVDRVFNDIWEVKRRGLLRKNVLVYWAVLTMGPIIFGLVLLFGGYIVEALKSTPILQSTLSVLIPLLFSTLAFTLLYMLVPNRRIAWRDAIVGGLIAALLFIALTNGFTAIFKRFQVYAILYSAFSVLPAFFLWLYVFWLIVLLGASITASLPILKYERWRKTPRVGDDLPEALMVLYVLHQARSSPAHMMNWSSIQKQLRLNSEDLADIMLKLQENGWVGKIRRTDDAIGWALICDTDEVTLADLYDVFVFDSQYFAEQAQQQQLPWANHFTALHHSDYHRIFLSELFEKH